MLGQARLSAAAAARNDVRLSVNDVTFLSPTALAAVTAALPSQRVGRERLVASPPQQHHMIAYVVAQSNARTLASYCLCNRAQGTTCVQSSAAAVLVLALLQSTETAPAQPRSPKVLQSSSDSSIASSEISALWEDIGWLSAVLLDVTSDVTSDSACESVALLRLTCRLTLPGHHSQLQRRRCSHR